MTTFNLGDWVYHRRHGVGQIQSARAGSVCMIYVTRFVIAGVESCLHDTLRPLSDVPESEVAARMDAIRANLNA